MQCPAEWTAKLDPDYLCLPKNTESGTTAGLGLFGPGFPGTVADPPTGTEDFKSFPFWCGNGGVAGEAPAAGASEPGDGCGGLCGTTSAGFSCADQESGAAAERAEQDPFGSPPICTTFIDE